LNDLFSPHAGGVLSADIAVPEHEREIRFYSRVLSTGNEPLWRKDLMNNLGMPVIGLGAISPEYAALPLQWMPHIQVTDVAASVQRALPFGATVLMEAKGETGSSQWAVLLDPNRAAFGMIPVISPEQMPPLNRASSGAGNRVGRISWLDLTVSDASSTRDFYRQVVGWSAQDVEMRDGEARYADYNMLGSDGKPAAGICHARGANTGLPPVWLLYLPVGDLGESLRIVEEEGGAIVKAIRDGGGKDAHAVVRDPVGAYFALTRE
jgi:predicted enzyme related to lactoylglutathione lyase